MIHMHYMRREWAKEVTILGEGDVCCDQSVEWYSHIDRNSAQSLMTLENFLFNDHEIIFKYNIFDFSFGR